MNFNATFFSHPKSIAGTLSSEDDEIRRFWIEHGKRARKVGEYFGRELGQTCYTNHWIPDGMKDTCIDKLAPRHRLAESLDEMFREKIDPRYNVDSVESKLFGLGSESYVVGSAEFYENYAFDRRNCIVCLDSGHFHPTEYVSDKNQLVPCFRTGADAACEPPCALGQRSCCVPEQGDHGYYEGNCQTGRL